jgi:glycosyltransferase involved in cell wall biosynthesis
MKYIIYRQLKRGDRLALKALAAYRGLLFRRMGDWRLLRMPQFKTLMKRIKRNNAINVEDVLPFISHENLKYRLWFNLKLAEAAFEMGNHEQAKVFAKRVWLFSNQDERYLPMFIKVHAACGDIDSIREAHKALGFRKAENGKISEALKHFNDWQYAYAVHRKTDEYHYDIEVLDRIAFLAGPHAFPKTRPHIRKGGKIRLAHLMFGLTHANSVIVEISLLFAKYHDPSRFDVTFFVPEPSSEIWASEEAVGNLDTIKKLGWNVVVVPAMTSSEKHLIALARSIHESSADILVTSAALADMRHYFIASLRPAPVTIGLCQGPAPQYIAPDFHWGITWFKSLVPDCPVNCSFVNLRMDLPERKLSRKDAKSILGIPASKLAIMTAGRPAKLQDVDFLQTLIDSVSSHRDAYLVIVGLGELPAALCEGMDKTISDRIKVLGWVKNFIEVLSMADIVVDTYPSGGGVLIKDAASLGTPVISFKHDYMKTFSQKECSAAEEVIGIPELIIERGDFSALKAILSNLMKDDVYREKLGQFCQVRIHETSGNSRRMIEDCENIFEAAIESYGK